MVETPVGNPGSRPARSRYCSEWPRSSSSSGSSPAWRPHSSSGRSQPDWPPLQETLDGDPASYLRGPLPVGGVGLLTSVVVDFARRTPPERVGLALAVRLLLVGACLSAAVQWLQYREASGESRRANGYAYAGFVGVWTAFTLGLYALWL